jgi:ornithine cyclodeaminase/alanine dehydrogenase-like protein (mu-crystallin family)
MPPAQILQIGEESQIMAISAHVKPLQIAGLKWVASFRYNLEEYGLPTHISTIILNDSLKAIPLAVIDAQRGGGFIVDFCYRPWV